MLMTGVYHINKQKPEKTAVVRSPAIYLFNIADTHSKTSENGGAAATRKRIIVFQYTRSRASATHAARAYKNKVGLRLDVAE